MTKYNTLKVITDCHEWSRFSYNKPPADRKYPLVAWNESFDGGIGGGGYTTPYKTLDEIGRTSDALNGYLDGFEDGIKRFL